MRRFPLFLASLLLAVAGSAAGQGASDPYQGDMAFRDKVRLDIGWVFASFDSKASLDGSGTSGTTIDLEEDAGLEKDTNDFFLRGHYRFKPKHRLEASYYALRREGERVLTRTIDWGDEEYVIGGTLKTDMKSSFGRIGYAWSFVKKEKVEVALHGDLAYIESGITLEGDTSSGSIRKEDGSAGFPYPTIGLSLGGNLGHHVVADLRVDAIGGVEVGGVKGSILAGEVGVRYYPTSHFGIGVHWLLWEMDAKTTDASRDFEVDTGWDGATGTFSFVW